MKNCDTRHFFLFIFCLIFSSGLLASSQASNCEEILRSAANRKVRVQKFLASIKFLKDVNGSTDVPLGSLFRVALDDDVAVQRRVSELSQETSKEAILKLPEFKALLSCAGKASEKLQIADLAFELANMNTEKIAFLKMETTKREQFGKAYETHRLQNGGHIELTKRLQKSTESIQKAREEIIASESEATNTNANPESEALSEMKRTLSQLEIDLEKQQVEFIQNLAQRSDSLENQISKIVPKGDQEIFLDKAKLGDYYKSTVSVWRAAAETLFSLFVNIDLDIEAKIPIQEVFGPANEDQKKTYLNYLAKLETLKIRFQELSDDRLKLINNVRARNFEILSQTGLTRAQLLVRCDEIGCTRERGITEQNISDLILELKLVPFKVAAGAVSKFLEVKSKFSSGFNGWINLAKQFLFLLLLCFIPFLVMKSLSWISTQLSKIRKNLLNRSMMDYRKRTIFATWISRLNPFVPSVGMLLALIASRKIVEKTDFNEISKILFYAEAFFAYRILRNILTIFFEILFSTESVDRIKIQKEKIEKSTAAIARLLLLEFILFHLTEDAVRKAFVYGILDKVTFWINIALVFILSSSWRKEIIEACISRFPKFESTLRLWSSRKVLFFMLPFVFTLVFLNDFVLWINSYLVKIDFVKRLLSDVLRRKLESVEKEDALKSNPPKEYLVAFDYYLPASEEVYVESSESPLLTVIPMIKNWSLGQKSDDLAILIGNRGLGKSTALEKIATQLTGLFMVKKASVPARTIVALDLYLWLSEVCGVPLESIDDFKKLDNSLSEKKLILIDDCQNLFLGKIGGFEAYRAFLEIISLKTQNIFWCLAINSRAWSYIKGVFGQEHFYGKEFVLQPWKDFEIQNLILKRHEQTGFRRSFDKSIKAYGVGDSLGQQVEAQFFRLLWGQSRGNPRSSLMYWISAISSPGENMIHVGVPSFVSSNLVASMSDESLFILAAIARHENLSHGELRTVTGISDTVIRKCLKEGYDKDLIWFDGADRVRISSRAQYVIDYFLIGKNFLYE